MSDMEQHLSHSIPEHSTSKNGHKPIEIGAEGNVSKSPINLEEIDRLLSFLPPKESTTAGNLPSTDQHHIEQVPVNADVESLVSEVDSLLQSLDQATNSARNEVKGWDIERKRREAGQSTDTFVLETLAQDENPLVRTLAFCNPHITSSQLRKVARADNPWFQMVAANNSSTPSEVLDELSTSEVVDVRQGVARNPSTSPVTLHKLNVTPGQS